MKEKSLKLGQVIHQNTDKIVVIKEGEAYLSNSSMTSMDLLAKCSGLTGLSSQIQALFDANALTHFGSEDNLLSDQNIALKIPVNAPEIWAVGVTYKRQAAEHDQDIEKTMGKTEQLYDFVYRNKRAEVFFKGFSRTSRGPRENIDLRNDSNLVMPEAEMVLVIGQDGFPIGYTGGNDLTAWDIEKECPLFLNQAKIWDGSCSVGPFIIPADVFGDPYDCEARCVVIRDGETIVDSTGNTSGLKRSIEELCYYLNQNNRVPSGTLLFTGTTCVIPHDLDLRDQDIVEVHIEGVGKMANTVKKALKPDWDYPLREEEKELAR